METLTKILYDALENATDMLRHHCDISPEMQGDYMDCLKECDAALLKAANLKEVKS